MIVSFFYQYSSHANNPTYIVKGNLSILRLTEISE
jgi:hypothetical protein